MKRSSTRRFAVVLLATVAVSATAEAPARPGLIFARETFDFGTVAQGDAVAAQFPFENRGVVPLTVSPPTTGCDCTAAIVGATDIAPGERGMVRFSCDTARMAGAVRRTATIHTSEVDRRSVTLSLTGEVLLDVIAEPARVYLGSVVRGQRVESAFTVRLGSDGVRTTAILGARSTGAHVDVDWIPGDVAFHLTVWEDAPLGVFTQDVTLVTNSRQFPTWSVPVTGVVVDALPKRRW